MSARRVIWKAELVCLSCGREIGTARLESEHAPTPAYWLQQRCKACGGQPIRSGYVQRMVIDPPLTQAQMSERLAQTVKPARVGRPPKWVVELRKNMGLSA